MGPRYTSLSPPRVCDRRPNVLTSTSPAVHAQHTDRSTGQPGTRTARSTSHPGPLDRQPHVLSLLLRERKGEVSNWSMIWGPSSSSPSLHAGLPTRYTEISRGMHDAGIRMWSPCRRQAMIISMQLGNVQQQLDAFSSSSSSDPSPKARLKVRQASRERGRCKQLGWCSTRASSVHGSETVQACSTACPCAAVPAASSAHAWQHDHDLCS
jgi:hypothetical protein